MFPTPFQTRRIARSHDRDRATQIELLLLSSVLRMNFFQNPLYVLDFIVVTSSISLELYLNSLGANKHTEEMSGLLVLARLWRFIRIGHGIFSSSHMASEHELGEMTEGLRELEHEYYVALEKAAAKA